MAACPTWSSPSRGPGGLRIDVAGHVDSVHGGLRATFTDLPDAPLTRFVMTLYGGKKGLLENEKNTCRIRQFAHARLIGHNNLGAALVPQLKAKCKKKGGSK